MSMVTRPAGGGHADGHQPFQWTLTPATIAQLGRVTPFASRDQRHPPYNGIALVGRRLLATDRYRLTVADVDQDLPKLVLPATKLEQVLRAARGAPVRLTVGFGGTRLEPLRQRASAADLGAICEPYPIQELPSHVAGPAVGTIEVDVAMLQQVLDPLAAAAARVEVCPTGTTIALAPVAAGTPPEAIPARCTGELEPFTVNAKFLGQGLACWHGPTLKVEVLAGRELRPLRLAQPGWTHVLMPVWPGGVVTGPGGGEEAAAGRREQPRVGVGR